MRASSVTRARAIPDEQISHGRRPLAPAEPRPAGPWPSRGWLAIWYAAFAGYAAVIAVVSAASYERSWGTWAVGSYAVAAIAAGCWRSHGRDAALLVSTAGALVAPVTWLATQAGPTPDVRVVGRAAVLLLRHGTPYLPADQIAHAAAPIVYNPYLPAMAVFGMPKAIGMTGLAGDPRPWLVAATAALLILAFRIAGRGDAVRCTLLAIASPVLAFPLAMGITDPPVLALICLALALLSRTSPKLPVWPAAIAIGVACAMKYTAWPALPVIAAMIAARDGARAAARFTAAAAATAVVLVVAFAPAALASPHTFIQNTVLFPLAMTPAHTPAASPLPGHLLAMTGSAGHLAAIGLLIAAGLAMAAWLVVRPPADTRAAVWRLAIGLSLMFALDPATRFGYFAYPLGLCGWLVLCDRSARVRRELVPGFLAGLLARWDRRDQLADRALRGVRAPRSAQAASGVQARAVQGDSAGRAEPDG